MSKNKFEKSISSDEHIQSDLQDAGISRPDEWKEATDVEIKGMEFAGDELFEERRANIADMMARIVEGDLQSGEIIRASPNFQREIATQFIENYRGYEVAKHLEVFPCLDHGQLAQQLLAAGQGGVVARYLDKFQVSDQSIAWQLIDAGFSREVTQHLDKFDNLNLAQLVLRLIAENSAEDDDHRLDLHLDNFPGLDRLQLAQMLIVDRNGWYVVRHLDEFPSLDHGQLAQQLFAAGEGAVVAGYLDKFQGLGREKLVELFLLDLPEGMRTSVAPYFGDWFDGTRPTFANFFAQLKKMDALVTERPELVKDLLDPAIKAQGIGAFRVLESITTLAQAGAVASREDSAIIAHIVTTKGVRANDGLLFLVGGLRGSEGGGFVDEEGQDIGWQADQAFAASKESSKPFFKTPLSQNPHLGSFLDSGMPLIDTLYKKHEAVMTDASLNPTERNQALSALQEHIRVLIERVRDGKIEEADLRDDSFVGIVYHVFPPATTLDRGQYRNLLSCRQDRSADLPEAWGSLNEASEARLEVARGAWVLREGERTDTNAWRSLSEAIRDVNTKPIDQWNDAAAALSGKRLVEALGNQKAMNKDRTDLLKAIYAFHRSANGATLTTDTSSREGLLEIKEYAGDRMKDTIDLLLKAYANADPSGYEKTVKEATTVSIQEKAKKGIFKQLLNILGTLSMDAEETNIRFKAVLDRYGIHVEGDALSEVLKVVEGIPNNDDTAQRKAVEQFLKGLLDGAAMSRNAGKLSVDITNRLIGDDYASMQEEMGRYEFQEDAEGSKGDIFHLEVSKKRAHAVAGLNMGVCVAVDEQLWQKETFSNVILWDAEGTARGGMHFEIVEDDNKTYLSLPGINPSGSAIGQAGAEKLFDGMLSYAKEAARRIGAEAVLIPTASVIHSNRAEMQSVLASKGYKTLSLKKGSHEFSYAPHHYSWNDAFVVELE